MEIDKDVKTTPVSVDQIVEVEKGYLVDAILSAAAGGASTVTIYDGHNTSGKVLVILSCVASTKDHLNPREPIPFENGLYVDVGSNVASLLVQSKRAE